MTYVAHAAPRTKEVLASLLREAIEWGVPREGLAYVCHSDSGPDARLEVEVRHLGEPPRGREDGYDYYAVDPPRQGWWNAGGVHYEMVQEHLRDPNHWYFP